MSRLIERARALMERPGAWLDQQEGRYPLRLGHDRRSRVLLTLDEASFNALIEAPGLRRRTGGGWQARAGQGRGLSCVSPPAPPPGRPGVIEGEREVILADGQLVPLRANLGESPILWLARRKDASGRPWLTPAEIAAGERLRADAEMARCGASVTMSWDALPRSGSGSSRALEPGERSLQASQSLRLALNACSPRLLSTPAPHAGTGLHPRIQPATGRTAALPAPQTGKNHSKTGTSSLGRALSAILNLIKITVPRASCDC